jgi:hypothetical protein
MLFELKITVPKDMEPRLTWVRLKYKKMGRAVKDRYTFEKLLFNT